MPRQLHIQISKLDFPSISTRQQIVKLIISQSIIKKEHINWKDSNGIMFEFPDDETYNYYAPFIKQFAEEIKNELL